MENKLEMTEADIKKITGIAVKASNHFPYSLIPIDELVSEGVIAFLEGRKKYDSTKNNYYWGFIYKRVYGQIQDILKLEAKLGLLEVFREEDPVIEFSHKEITMDFSSDSPHMTLLFKEAFNSITPTEQSILYDYYVKQIPYYKIAEKYKTKLHKVRNIVQSLSQYLKEVMEVE